MRRGTTPTLEVEVDEDITAYNIRLALDDGETLVVKEGADLSVSLDGDKTVVRAILTQAETLRFRDGRNVEVQIRAADASGYPAIATTIASIPVERILQEGVLDG